MPEEIKEAPQIYELSDETHVIKTLGVAWHPIGENFTFNTKMEKTASLTKRELVSETAKLFDPMGWVSLVTIVFKILIQEAWISGCAWDSKLNDNILQRWKAAQETLTDLHQVSIKRCNLPPGKATEVQLHVFADASEKAYAAVVYTVIRDKAQLMRNY